MRIEGAFNVFPRGSYFPKFGHKLTLTVGEKISPVGKTIEELNKQIKESVERL
jgi:hypothetical protein